VLRLRISYVDEGNLKYQAVNKMTPAEVCSLLEQYSKTRKKFYINIVHNISDLILAFQRVEYSARVVSTDLQNGFIGVFGMFSAIFYLYALYGNLDKD